MEPTWLIVGSLVLALVEGGLLWYALRNVKSARLIKKTQITPIAQLTPGYAAVEGRVLCQEGLLEAPITGRPCAAWILRFKYTTESDVPIATEVKAVPWVLDDGTGRAEVAEGASILARKHRSEGSFEDGFLERAGQAYGTRGSFSEEEIRHRFRCDVGDELPTQWCEFIIAQGDRLYVVGPISVEQGRARLNPAPGAFFFICQGGREEALLCFRQRAAWWFTAFVLAPLAVACAYYGIVR